MKEVFPHITDQVAIFYALGEDEKIYAWNPVTHEWEIFKNEQPTDSSV